MMSNRTSRWRKSGDALMRPFDPRLLRVVPSARGPVAALAAMGVAAGVATIATAFALTGLVVAVVDDRLREMEEQLHEVNSRLLVLEQKKSSVAPEPRQKPWLWIAFLIALVVVFQLLRRVR